MASSSSSSALSSNTALLKRLQQESAYLTKPLHGSHFLELKPFSEGETAFYFYPSEESSRSGELRFNLCEFIIKKEKEATYTSRVIPLCLIQTPEGINLQSAPELSWEGGLFDRFLERYSTGRYAVVPTRDVFTPGFYVDYSYKVVLTKNYLGHSKKLKEEITESINSIVSMIEEGRELEEKDKSIDLDSWEGYLPDHYFFEWHKKDLRPGIDLPEPLKHIKRMRFFIGNPVRHRKLDISYEDSTKKSIQGYLPPFSLANLNAKSWKMMRAAGGGAIDWSDQDEIYKEFSTSHFMSRDRKEFEKEMSIKGTYTYLQIHMRHILRDRILEIASYNKSNQPIHIQLWDVACGTTIDLLKQSVLLLETEMKRNYPAIALSVKATGLDFQPNNIDKCIKKMGEDKSFPSNINFVVKNAMDIEDLVLEEKKSSTKSLSLGAEETKSSSTGITLHIALCSGFLTRATVDHGYQSLSILQAMWRAGIHTIIQTGQTESEFCGRMLKRIGFEAIEEYNDRNLEPILGLTRISLEDRARKLIEKLRLKRDKNKLDLSMSPDPVSLLEYIVTHAPDLLSRIVRIDLSFCDVREPEKFNALCKELPALNEIIYLSDKPLPLFLPKEKVKYREVKSNIHLFASEAFLARMQHDVKGAEVHRAKHCKELLDDATSTLLSGQVVFSDCVIKPRAQQVRNLKENLRSCSHYSPDAIKEIFGELIEKCLRECLPHEASHFAKIYNNGIEVVNLFLNHDVSLLKLLSEDTKQKLIEKTNAMKNKDCPAIQQFVESYCCNPMKMSP